MSVDGDLRALVTGGSSGLGEAFTRALVARGRRVVVVARREERLKALAASLGGEPAVTAVPLDLVAAGTGEHLEAVLRAKGIGVDLLVNNAGVGHTGRFHEQPAERILAMVELNTRALVDLTRRFLPGMVARGRGAVINVASMSAFQPVPFLSVYAATKAFVLSLTEGLATELAGTGVVVQALCPGNVPTEFQQVAGTDKTAFNRTPKSSPDEVVSASLEALDHGRLVVIPGLQNRLSVGMQRLVPRRWVRHVAGEMFRPGR